MEKIDQPLRKSYLPLSLYIEDLKALEDTLREVGAKVGINTTDHRFDSVAELKSECPVQKFHQLEVKAPDPYVSLELLSFSATLYVGSSKTVSAAVFYKLDTILTNARRRPYFLYSYPFLWLSVLFPWLLGRFVRSEISIPLMLLILFWTIWGHFVRGSRHSTITLKSRAESRGFFSRNKDVLITNLISAVVGMILGIVGTLVVSHLLGQQPNKRMQLPAGVDSGNKSNEGK